MPNPTRPQYQEIIESSWGRAVADTVVRRYSSTAERGADLAGIPVDELEGASGGDRPGLGSGPARPVLSRAMEHRFRGSPRPPISITGGRSPGAPRDIGSSAGWSTYGAGSSGGLMNLAALNLPVGYRPAEAHVLVVRMASSPESVASLAVGAGGDIVPQATGAAWNIFVSLDGVVFDPDAGTSTTRPGIEEDLGDELDEGASSAADLAPVAELLLPLGLGVRLVVLHTAEGARTFEDLGAFFAGDSGVSSHVGIDDTPGIIGEYVRPENKAWTQGNAVIPTRWRPSCALSPSGRRRSGIDTPRCS